MPFPKAEAPFSLRHVSVYVCGGGVCGCVCARAHSCPILCNPIDCSPPGSFVCPWDFPGKNTAVGSHFLLQGIFLTQGSNPRPQGLLHWQVDSSPLRHLGSLWVVCVYL